MSLTPCLESQCGRVAEYRGRCRVHATERNRATHQTGRLRPDAGRLYDTKQWAVTARQVRDEEPLCRICIAEGEKFPAVTTQVDHIVPIEQGGPPYERDNLQGLCASHHSQKSNREMRSTHA